MLALHAWVKAIRLGLAFLLTPVIILVWLNASFDFDVAIWHREIDGPAGVVLAFFVFPAVVLILILAWGLDVFLLLAKDNLRFRAIAVTTLLIALTSGLLIYLATWPWGAFSFAPALGGLSALGVIVSVLSFYAIGLWKTAPGR